MSRDTDRQIIDEYHTVTGQLLEVSHELLVSLRLVADIADVEAVRKALVLETLDSVETVLLSVYQTHKRIMAAQQENVRRSIHGDEA